MSLSSEGEPPTMITIDPDGDALFYVGNSLVKVSSHVLSLASPVFRAMLGPHFKEGNRMREGEAISLPDDDLESFKVLCNILHYRSSEVPLRFGLQPLLDLAVICDKYQCIAPVMSLSIMWITQLSKSASFEEKCQLLLISYILDLPELFASFSWAIVRLHCADLIGIALLSEHPLMRHDLIAALHARREHLIVGIDKAIIKAISRLFRSRCSASQKAIGHYFQKIKELKLLLSEEPLADLCFDTLTDRVAGFPETVIHEHCTSLRCGKDCNAMKMSSSLRAEVDKLSAEQIGICLDCLKTNGDSKIQGKCRVTHGDL